MSDCRVYHTTGMCWCSNGLHTRLQLLYNRPVLVQQGSTCLTAGFILQACAGAAVVYIPDCSYHTIGLCWCNRGLHVWLQGLYYRHVLVQQWSQLYMSLTTDLPYRPGLVQQWSTYYYRITIIELPHYRITIPETWTGALVVYISRSVELPYYKHLLVEQWYTCHRL